MTMKRLRVWRSNHGNSALAIAAAATRGAPPRRLHDRPECAGRELTHGKRREVGARRVTEQERPPEELLHEGHHQHQAREPPGHERPALKVALDRQERVEGEAGIQVRIGTSVSTSTHSPATTRPTTTPSGRCALDGRMSAKRLSEQQQHAGNRQHLQQVEGRILARRQLRLDQGERRQHRDGRGVRDDRAAETRAPRSPRPGDPAWSRASAGYHAATGARRVRSARARVLCASPCGIHRCQELERRWDRGEQAISRAVMRATCRRRPARHRHCPEARSPGQRRKRRPEAEGPKPIRKSNTASYLRASDP